MSSTMYRPLDGAEIKKILTNQFNLWLNSLYLLKPFSAFHKCILKVKFEMSAFPSDVPVPNSVEVEFEYYPKRFEEIKSKFKGYEMQIQELEELKKEIDEVLNIVNPILIRNINMDAGDTPDRLRIANGLPSFRIDNSGNSTKEVAVYPKAK